MGKKDKKRDGGKRESRYGREECRNSRCGTEKCIKDEVRVAGTARHVGGGEEEEKNDGGTWNQTAVDVNPFSTATHFFTTSFVCD